MHVGKGDISWRTFALIFGGAALLAGFVMVGTTMPGYVPPARAQAVAAVVSDIGSIIFGLLAAAILVAVAFRFRRGNPLRQIWLLLGIGIGLYAAGDVVWTVLDVGSGFTEVPYPSAADVLYLSMYFFMGLGLLKAVKAFRRVTYAEAALKLQVILMFLVSVAMYVFVIAPIIVDAAATLPQKVFGAIYPIGDIVVFVGPAVFIAFVAGAIGRTQSVRHWWVLAGGLAVMSVSDLAFTWLDWRGLYYSGHPVDYLWMLSLLAIAVAGSLAADVSIATAPAPAAVPVRGVSSA